MKPIFQLGLAQTITKKWFTFFEIKFPENIFQRQEIFNETITALVKNDLIS